MLGTLLIPLLLLAGGFVIASAAIKVVQEYERGVIFRLGRLIGPKGPGLFLLIPIVDRMVKVDLRIVVLDGYCLNPGDLSAGRAVGALFYPIVPGHEDLSWERFFTEAAGRFFAGAYAGAYEDARIEEFLKVLPETPPWRT